MKQIRSMNALDETEAALNALIERRAANAEHDDDPQAREESWKESVRAYNAEHREARRHQWVSYYRTLAESFRRRSEECAEKAERLGQ